MACFDCPKEKLFMSHYKPLEIKTLEVGGINPSLEAMRLPMLGRKTKSTDDELASKLIRRGTSHAKFQRGVEVWLKATFQIGWLVELETYRIGLDTLSTSSTMHNELRDLVGEELAEEKQLGLVDKQYVRISKVSYQTLRKIYIERRKHRHPDWQIFCDWVETLPKFTVLIMPELFGKIK
jgi:hypothetical protein